MSPIKSSNINPTIDPSLLDYETHLTDYTKYIHRSRYSRFIDELGRRETWKESVSRLCDFWQGRFPDLFPYDDIFSHIIKTEVMPSMRSLMTAGKALDRDEVSAYNCSFLAIDEPKAFDEAMYLLMNGVGVGFSVERQFVSQLPAVSEEFYYTDTVIVVSDSKIGWCTALRELLSLLWSGKIPTWDLSKLRPAGARLKTFGGRSSGPGPLNDLFNFAVSIFKYAAGRKLTSIECHDLMCKIGEVVVVGGVRRSALISLSNLSDDRMRDAKSGAWWETNGQRALANNSVAYTEKPEIGIFMKEWKALYDSKSGERGIFNRVAAWKSAKRYGRRRWEDVHFGANPCAEIFLRPKGFCNLTEVVVRPEDTLEDLIRKVTIATILGTFQSTLTNFRYLSVAWKRNAEEERLLGVSLTGVMDHEVLGYASDLAKEWLTKLREVTLEVNKEWAEKLGIPVSAAITTNKPSGTVSQLVNCSSGIHGRFSKYYIRTVRADKKDPLAILLKDCGIPCEDDITKPNSTYVFSFPMKSPDTSRIASELTALEQLEVWKMYKDYWTEHNPSVTIYVKEDEWMEVGAWVYKNFDSIGGLSFLPSSDHVYKQAPYQEINEKLYQQMVAAMPPIAWEKLVDYEKEDSTIGSQELACAGGACELPF